MVRPSALAVLILRMNSNLVGRSTGKSLGLAPLENLVHVLGGVPIEVAIIRPISHKAASQHHISVTVHCGQVILKCKLGDPGSLGCEHRVIRHK